MLLHTDSMKILLVEDDATSLLLLQAIVEHLGHECLVTNDGIDAWALLQSTSVEVVISDWMMPGLSGLQLCRHIRSDSRLAETYFILLTSKKEQEDFQRGERAGADAYMTKPVKRAQLQSLLDEVAQITPRPQGDKG